jgi:hypothetical protein
MDMGVALVLDQGDLADARVAMAKDDAVALGQPGMMTCAGA